MTGSIGSIGSVLVANRGEIVVRVCRTLASFGIRSIAVYAPDDAGAPHTMAADLAVAVTGYLDAGSIVDAAEAAGADAVHPGYGFLSEDAAFARAVLGAGLLWVGPPPEVIETMGDKIRAKQTVAAAGVPVVPGAGGHEMDDDALAAGALELGLPVLVKPAAGGGGKGMRLVTAAEDLLPAFAAARREAEGAFGDGTLLVERWIERPRHVEVQVLADAFGSVVHLGERECSLQRRHQKIVEESPSPFLDGATRAAMTRSAVDAAAACGYVGAGTVEFVVAGDRPDAYFFVEMNTRLQVEHAVSELVTGVDLVEWQLRVAAGEPLALEQPAMSSRGHAVEARVYAEDPERGFLPSAGTVLHAEEPLGWPGVRVDSALAGASTVGTRYDPMLAKVVAWGVTRAEALARLRAALRETAVLGLTTNVGYLVRLLAHPDVVAGRLDTGLVDRTLAALAAPDAASARDAAVAAACRLAIGLEPAGPYLDPWEVADGWTLAGARPWVVAFRQGGRAVSVSVQGRVPDGATVRVDGGPPLFVRAETPDPGSPAGSLARSPAGSLARSPAGSLARSPAWSPNGSPALWVTIDGERARWLALGGPDEIWVSRHGDAWRFVLERSRSEGAVLAGSTGAVGSGGAGVVPSGPSGSVHRVTSPMPGVVVAVHVAAGTPVSAGQPLAVLEAMKMEHVVLAPSDGVVAEVFVRSGQSVGLDELLARLEPTRAEAVETAGRDADERGSA